MAEDKEPQIWTSKMEDSKEARETIEEIREALAATRIYGVDYSLGFMVASLTRAQLLFERYAKEEKIDTNPEVTLINWTLDRIYSREGDESILFERAVPKVIKKLGDIGFRDPERKKVPWLRKMLEHTQLNDRLTPEAVHTAVGGAKLNPKKKSI